MIIVETDYTKYLSRARTLLLYDAQMSFKNQYWERCFNDIYRACINAVSALLCKNKMNAKTYADLKIEFGRQFVKTGKIAKEDGDFLIALMDQRYESEYGDFSNIVERFTFFKEETVEPLFVPAKKFLQDIEELIGHND